MMANKYFWLSHLFSSYMSRRPTTFSPSGCLQFDVFKNFERVVTNRNSRFAAVVHLSTSVTLSEWTNGERPIIFSRSRVRALNMVVGKFSPPVSCLREKKRALEDLALT